MVWWFILPVHLQQQLYRGPMTRLFLAFFATLIFFTAFPAQAAADQSLELIAETRYPMGDANLYTFTSGKAGRDFQVMISVPGGHEAPRTDKKFPVIYVVDGQWSFRPMGQIAGGLHYDRNWVNSIIVGITWKGDVNDAERLRLEDLTPTAVEDSPGTGRGDRYLDFLQHELIPYIEANFSASDHRILAGSSLGGLITGYCLFTRPELFRDYIATSPAAWWDDGMLLKAIKKFDGTRLSSPTRLYLSRGEVEFSNDGADQMAAAIKARGLPNLQVQFDIIKGAGHGSLNAESYTRALQFLFLQKWVDIPKQTLMAYAGRYSPGEHDHVADVSIVEKEGRLYLEQDGPLKMFPVVAVEENLFYLPGMGAELSFNHEGDGPVTSALLKPQFGGPITFRRMK